MLWILKSLPIAYKIRGWNGNGNEWSFMFEIESRPIRGSPFLVLLPISGLIYDPVKMESADGVA